MKPHGLCAFPITPASPDGVVDTAALGRLVSRIVEAGADSVCVLGSTGGYAYLSLEQRRIAIEAAVSQAASTPVLAGIGALRQDQVIAAGMDAQAAGAAAVLLAPVSYTPLLDHEVFVLYEQVASALDVPVCIYNNPGTTHFSFSNELVVRLSRVPGIVAVKNPAPPADAVPGHLETLRKATAAGFSLGYSGDWNAAEAMIAGADAWYSVAAGLFPNECLAIVRAAQRGDVEQARSLNARLEPLWALFRELSSLRVMVAAANILGEVAALPLPLLPLSTQDHRRVEAALEAVSSS